MFLPALTSLRKHDQSRIPSEEQTNPRLYFVYAMNYHHMILVNYFFALYNGDRRSKQLHSKLLLENLRLFKHGNRWQVLILLFSIRLLTVPISFLGFGVLWCFFEAPIQLSKFFLLKNAVPTVVWYENGGQC